MGSKITFDQSTIQEQIEYSYSGYENIEITEFDTINEPQIKAGSIIEVNGTIYRFDVNESIVDWSTHSAEPPLYVILTGDGNTCTPYATSTIPVWDGTRNGYYVGDSRAIPYGFKGAFGAAEEATISSSDPYYEAGSFWYDDDLVIIEVGGGRYFRRMDGFSTTVKDSWLQNGDNHWAAMQEPGGSRIVVVSESGGTYYAEMWSGWKGTQQWRTELWIGEHPVLIWWVGNQVHVLAQHETYQEKKREDVLDVSSGAKSGRWVFPADDWWSGAGYYDYDNDVLYCAYKYSPFHLKKISPATLEVIEDLADLPAPPLSSPRLGSGTANEAGPLWHFNEHSGNGIYIRGYAPGAMEWSKYYVNNNIKIFPDNTSKLFRKEDGFGE